MTNETPSIALPEGFKEVPSNPLFAVSEDGRVYHIQRGVYVSRVTTNDGVPEVVYYTYDPITKKNTQHWVAVQDLIQEAFGKAEENYDWGDIPEFPAYKIRRDGTKVVNQATKEVLPIYQDEVYLYKSGRDREPTLCLISDLLRSAFPPEESNPEYSERIEHQTKTITVNNPTIAREALLQIQRTKGRHYPGPLRDQTIWDLIDHLVEQLDKPDEEPTSDVWRPISEYPDYEINVGRGKIRNKWNQGLMTESYPEHLELRHVTGDWRLMSFSEFLKLAK